MNQLTEEQRERVKQIRERQYNRSAGKLSARELEIFKDVESLLSLLNRHQAPEGSSVSTLIGYEAGYSDGRDACVEKMREILRPYELEFRRKTNSATNIVDYAVMALQSLNPNQ